MKIGRKLVAFLAVFLTIFNSGFSALAPIAFAAPVANVAKLSITQTDQFDNNLTGSDFTYTVKKTAMSNYFDPSYTELGTDTVNPGAVPDITLQGDYLLLVVTHTAAPDTYYRDTDVKYYYTTTKTLHPPIGRDGHLYSYISPNAVKYADFEDELRPKATVTVQMRGDGSYAYDGDTFRIELHNWWNDDLIAYKTLTWSNSGSNTVVFDTNMDWGYDYYIKGIDASGDAFYYHSVDYTSTILNGFFGGFTANNRNETVTVTYGRYQGGDVKIFKKAKDYGGAIVAPIAGRTYSFQLVRPDNTVAANASMVWNGPGSKAEFVAPFYDTYTVKEVFPADEDDYLTSGYYFAGNASGTPVVASVTVAGNGETNLFCVNKPAGSVALRAEFPAGYSPSGTMTFELRDSSDATVSTKTISAAQWVSNATKFTVKWDKLPLGDYTVVETGNPGFSKGIASDSPNTILNGSIIQVDGDEAVVATHARKTGSASVRKDVVDAHGAPAGSYRVHLVKTANGRDGVPSETFDQWIDVNAGQTVTAGLTSLPLGIYTVSESAAGYSTGISVRGGAAAASPVNFEINGDDTALVPIVVTNTKLYGSITVSKTIDNFTNGDDGMFLFDLYRGELSAPDENQFVGVIPVIFPVGGTAATLSATFPAALEYGKYTVFESVGATMGYVPSTPGNDRQVVDLQGASAAAAFHNTKVYGAATVTKVMNDAHNSANDTDFTVRITGVNDGQTVYSHDVTIHRGQTIGTAADAALGRLPVGHYTVAELDADGSPLFGYTSQITPSAFDIAATTVPQSVAIAVANTKLYGTVSVNKTIDNFTAGDTGTFEFKLYRGELTAPDDNQLIESKSIAFAAAGTAATRSVSFDTALGYGKYTVFESPVSGYTTAAARQVVNLTAATAAASFTNTKVYGEVMVAKTLTDVGNPQSAAQFIVRITGNNGYTQDVTVGNGSMVTKDDIPALGRLPVGHYTVTELDAGGNPLTGYSSVISLPYFDVTTTTASQKFAITVANTKLYGGVNVTNNVTDSLNVPAGRVTAFDITITKTGDGADGTPGENFSRTIALGAGQTVTPSDAGYGFLGNLPLGRYTVTSSAPGYSTGISVDGAPATSTFELTSTSHGVISVVVSHVRLYGSINVTKAMQFEIPSGDTFGFRISGGPAGWVAPADISVTAGGTAGWLGLPVGTYKVTELDKPGYEFLYFSDGTPVANEQAVTVDITASSPGFPVELTAENRKLGSIELTKDVLGATGDTTPFSIRITGPSYPNGHDVTLTEAGGAVTLGNLKYGDYTIAETIPADRTDEYRLDDIYSTDGSTGAFAGGSYSFTIGMGREEVLNPITAAITVSNLKFAAIDLTKLDSVTGAAPVGSSAFRVEKLVAPVDNTPKLAALDTTPAAVYVGTITTDPVTGKGALGALEPGRYRVTETGAPAGYDFADAQEFTVDAGQSAPLTFVNVPHGWLKIVKTDSDTGRGIDGVTFKLAANAAMTDAENFPVRTYTTAGGGLIPDEGGIQLVKGTYYLQEIAAPAGYAIDGTVRPVSIELNQTNTQRIANDAQSWLNIAVNSVQGGGVANVVLSVQREQPNVFLRAIEAIAGASYDPFTLTTGADGTVTSNPLFPGRYTATMTSADPGWVLLDPLSQTAELTLGNTSSLTFLVRPEGSVVVTKTDSLSEAPLAGVNFELSADSTFAQGSEKFAATTGADGTATFEHLLPGSYFVREVSAAPGYGYHPDDVRPVTVVRAEAATVAFANDPVGLLRITNTDSLFGTPVGGAPFGIYASQAAADADTGNTGAGALQKVTAAADGTILSGQLTLTGDTTTFFVKQLATPAGYLANANVYSAGIALNDRINEDGQPKPVNVEVPNVPLGNLEITKVDSLDASLKLEGASFDLFADAALTDKAGSGTTDANGLAVIADLAPGDYWLVETAAPEGYVLNAAPIPLSLNPSPDNLNVRNGKWYEAVTVLDEANPPAGLETGDLKLIKTDSLTGKRLPGATFKFFADAARTDLVAEETTDKNGEILLEGLDPATYYVVETKAPTDYVLNNTPIPVVVRADQVNPLNLVNEYNPPEGVQTGMMDYNIVLGGIAVLLIGAGLIFFAGRKRKAKSN